MANISVEPISLIEKEKRLQFLNEEKEGWARVRKFSSNMWTVRTNFTPHRNVQAANTSKTDVNALRSCG